MSATTIQKFESLTGACILADVPGSVPEIEFAKFNLIYGFNGSGKSTLSRIFNSLRSGVCDPKLPQDCSFRVRLSDSATLVCPGGPSGLEDRLKVFNADFVEENLQWNQRRANPIFYIGHEQAQLAAELEAVNQQVASTTQEHEGAQKTVREQEKTFATFKRERARLISAGLKERGRKYEAPQLVNDIATLDLGESAELDQEHLASALSICAQEGALSEINEVALDSGPIRTAVEKGRELLSESPSSVMLKELQDHPQMIVWAKAGLEYHQQNDVLNCILCGNTLTESRIAALRQALDARLSTFLSELDGAAQNLTAASTSLANLREALPFGGSVSPDLMPTLNVALQSVRSLLPQLEAVVKSGSGALAIKRSIPTSIGYERTVLATDLFFTLLEDLQAAIARINSVLRIHNARVADFASTQADARKQVRRHYAREANAEFHALKDSLEKAQSNTDSLDETVTKLRAKVVDLKSQLQKHGPAAEKINKLVASYLGHNELTISAVADGYEIHRHGKLLTGSPSEGEKTAIALCYFLSMFESGGRALKEQIVVMDDPISSLDTKALNFACSMVKSRTSGVAQFFLLTHNQHFMRDFVKAWKGLARQTPPEAGLFFLDVTFPKGKTQRMAQLVTMSKFLREYDFEYHFLFNHVLRFEAATDSEYEYAYMMPNVMRRVLDVFLAFRCPGGSGFTGKIDQLCGEYPDLDRNKMFALERLVQIESHSDSLDDLISLSSLTIEESRDAMESLLTLMKVVDAPHLKALRRLCKN